MKAKILLDGAHANGLKLIGDGFIGFRFVPRCDMAEAADELLHACFDSEQDGHDWIAENCDGPYDSALWSNIPIESNSVADNKEEEL